MKQRPEHDYECFTYTNKFKLVFQAYVKHENTDCIEETALIDKGTLSTIAARFEAFDHCDVFIQMPQPRHPESRIPLATITPHGTKKGCYKVSCMPFTEDADKWLKAQKGFVCMTGIAETVGLTRQQLTHSLRKAKNGVSIKHIPDLINVLIYRGYGSPSKG